MRTPAPFRHVEEDAVHGAVEFVDEFGGLPRGFRGERLDEPAKGHGLLVDDEFFEVEVLFLFRFRTIHDFLLSLWDRSLTQDGNGPKEKGPYCPSPDRNGTRPKAWTLSLFS